MAAPKESAAPTNCPRCARALPPGSAKVCVFCGTPLTVTPTRNSNLGFGPRPGRDPLVGRRRPAEATGLGLWVVHQVCDLVELRTGPAGTTIRTHMRLAGTAAPGRMAP